MKKIKVKIPAKININLDVSPLENGFHPIKSLVASVNVYDYITVQKRADSLITLSTTGLNANCPIEENNAYKTASAFINEFSLSGVDIMVEKNIPVSGGMGGSSADIAGVLIGLKKLFGVHCDLNALANKFGSDAGYMLNGGYALISGRGERVERLKIKQKFHLLLISEPFELAQKVCAKECYKEFDKQAKVYPPSTETAIKMLLAKDEENLFKVVKNDLYPSAKKLLPQIESNLESLAKFGSAVMTGSGATVVGYYKTKKDRDIAYKKLYSIYGEKLIKAKII